MMTGVPAHAMGVNPAQLQPLRPVKVLVLSSQDPVAVRLPGPFQVFDLKTQRVLLQADAGRALALAPTPSGMDIDAVGFDVDGVRIAPRASSPVYVNEQPFRGALRVIKDKGRLLVTNELDIEQYLCGVVSREMSEYWPMEALKAQAIAARTFALYHAVRDAKDKRPFHLTADTASQVYGGREAEHRRTNDAVARTQGLILTWQGRIFPAFYHANSGGHTEDIGQVWNIKLPPLSGVPDPYSRRTRYARWRQTVPWDEALRSLREAGVQVDGATHLKVVARNRSGRVKELELTGSGGPLGRVSGKQFQRVLGGRTVRSLKFTAAVKDGMLILTGQGWGHGVGLCQWGAWTMAWRGHTAEEILQHYYPGAQIERFMGQKVIADP